MPKEIAYQDLLGLPHRSGALDWSEGALDCAGAALEIIRRSEGPEAAATLRRALVAPDGEIPDTWVELPSLSVARPGDLILSHPSPDKLHLSALVTGPPLFLALSSAFRLGVYVARASTIQGIEGVYRWAGDAD